MSKQIDALKLALEAWEKGDGIKLGKILKKALAQPEYQSTADKSKLEKVPAKGTLLAQPEQEQIAVWLEKECDEQYLADRVRAGDYAKEKGHTENCAALADDIGKRHLSPSLVGVGVKDYTAQPEQEPVANGKLKVTLQDTPTEIELDQYKQMLQAACADLGAINEALGLDPNDGGAEPILFAIEELKGRSQEPMAWMVYTLDGTSVCVTDNPSSFTPEHRALPLYTTPPQRTWVGLTPQERDEINEQVYGKVPHHVAFHAAIEAKLKQKNGYDS